MFKALSVQFRNFFKFKSLKYVGYLDDIVIFSRIFYLIAGGGAQRNNCNCKRYGIEMGPFIRHDNNQ